MDDFDFSSKVKIPGTYGEFTIGNGTSKLRALYLETKIRPGAEGEWPNLLASHMKPWRELFPIEKVTFDELLQRDLNDSRVAHDLIPYLVGEEGDYARFFPPILAVLAPKKISGIGIEKTYPSKMAGGEKLQFGTVFDFHPPQSMNETGVIAFNPQKTAFIIVDGQHRAMAVLALHRQLNNAWGSNPYASYYSHLNVTPDVVKNIELPVCIVFFPDLTDDNEELSSRGISLDVACRELFLIVNRKAQPVSQARELLLDDDDLAARMMRHTLSHFKDRTEDTDTLARIYSFRYGDSEEYGKNVVAGQLEYTSAVALHKMHCISSFGNPDGFNMRNPAELTDKRFHRNPTRPIEILLGTDLEEWPSLTRKSGRTHTPSDVKKAVSYLGDLNDYAILKFFDEFWPFAVHNRVVRQLKTRMADPSIRADHVQSKCATILFDGSGVRSVFEEHFSRLQGLEEDHREEGRSISDYIKNQISDCKAVLKALDIHERAIKRQRACDLYNLNQEKLYGPDNDESKEKQQLIESKASATYVAVSTQAFQIGYLVTICTIVESFIKSDTDYQSRKAVFQSATDLIIGALNRYFTPKAGVKHDPINGIAAESRSDIFNSQRQGLRGMLAMYINELNEKQWVFFRYAILEILFSKHSQGFLKEWLEEIEAANDKETWIDCLAGMATETIAIRKEYSDRIVNKAINNPEFTRTIETTKAHMAGANHPDEEISSRIEELVNGERRRVEDIVKEHVKASVGALNSIEKIITKEFLGQPALFVTN